MQRKYNLAYFVFALGLTTLMIGVDAHAKIAFVSDRDGHSWDIYVMDDDGGNPRRLTNSPERLNGFPHGPPTANALSFDV